MYKQINQVAKCKQITFKWGSVCLFVHPYGKRSLAPHRWIQQWPRAGQRTLTKDHHSPPRKWSVNKYFMLEISRYIFVYLGGRSGVTECADQVDPKFHIFKTFPLSEIYLNAIKLQKTYYFKTQIFYECKLIFQGK